MTTKTKTKTKTKAKAKAKAGTAIAKPRGDSWVDPEMDEVIKKIGEDEARVFGDKTKPPVQDVWTSVKRINPPDFQVVCVYLGDTHIPRYAIAMRKGGGWVEFFNHTTIKTDIVSHWMHLSVPKEVLEEQAA